MENSLTGMTWDKWRRLSENQRAALRSTGSLTPQLVGLEGWRVEITYRYPSGNEECVRGIVSRSTGWTPIHILLKRRDSTGGGGVFTDLITNVRKLYKAR